MYMPYLRGKQFELIGLRELIDPILSKNKAKVSPIIEPVKDSSTLRNTINELIKKDINFTVIINPQVGTFSNPIDIFNAITDVIPGSNNFQIGVIFHKGIDHNYISQILENYKSYFYSLSIIHNTTDHIVGLYNTLYKNFNIAYNVINLSFTSRRYHRVFPQNTIIELDDYFQSQSKNSNYLAVETSDFSEEYLYYKTEGFVGFSDYLTIGSEYSESGFLPYAVAIHLSFEDSGWIKVKHFVSDSNDDTADIAGKFTEALDKLIQWCDNTSYDSIAVREFRKFHENGHFPGLGTIKKLSIMNHIELVLGLI